MKLDLEPLEVHRGGPQYSSALVVHLGNQAPKTLSALGDLARELGDHLHFTSVKIAFERGRNRE